MARHGENIRKRKDGRWEGRYLVYSEEKEKEKYRSVYGRSYGEVKEKMNIEKNRMRQPLGELQEEKKTEEEKMLFTDMAEQWLAEVKYTKKLSTYVKYSLIYRKYLEIAFQDVKLYQVADIRAVEKISDPLSDSMKKSICCVLNQVLKFASRNYGIIIPVLKKPACRGKRKSVTIFNQKEQSRLLSVLCHKQDIFKTAVLLCLYTGLRLGEVCALKWEDIDFENSLLTVNRTVQRIYANGYETRTVLLESPPKSEGSKREIPLSSQVLELLLGIWNNQEYVFGKDRPIEPRRLQYRFKNILKEAKVAHKNFHSLRHTFSTNCIEKGTDVKSLSEILGHSDVKITLNRYVHPSMATKRGYLNTLSEFYGQICGQDG